LFITLLIAKALEPQSIWGNGNIPQNVTLILWHASSTTCDANLNDIIP